MGTDNYRYNQQGFDQMLADDRSFHNDAKELEGAIIDSVRKHLLEEGIQGTTADALVEAFERDVIKSIDIFEESADLSMKENEQFQELMEDNTAANVRTASSI